MTEGLHRRLRQLRDQTSRLQNDMIQTFDRYRRGNKQTVEVRHVHIHSGGRGVIGIINPPEDREGGVGRMRHDPMRQADIKRPGYRKYRQAPAGVGRERKPSPLWTGSSYWSGKRSDGEAAAEPYPLFVLVRLSDPLPARACPEVGPRCR